MHVSGRRDEVDSNYDPARHSISYDHSDLIIVLGPLDEFCIRCADNIDDSWTYQTFTFSYFVCCITNFWQPKSRRRYMMLLQLKTVVTVIRLSYDLRPQFKSSDQNGAVFVRLAVVESCELFPDRASKIIRDETFCCFPLLSDQVKGKRIMMQARPLGPTLGGHGTPFQVQWRSPGLAHRQVFFPLCAGSDYWTLGFFKFEAPPHFTEHLTWPPTVKSTASTDQPMK